MRASLVPVLAAVALLAPAAGSAQSRSLFAYDAAAPLAVREAGAREENGARVVELSYASPKGGRVPATLVLPLSGPPWPAVVFQHGGGNASRRDFLAEAQDLAGAGVASLLVDAPFNRPPFRPWLTFTPRDRAAYIQNVVDLRRAVDLLEQRDEIDRDRIALVGFSYGGVLAGILAGVEPRFDAIAILSGPGRITDPLRQEGRRWVGTVAPAKRAARQAQLARYLAGMRAVDAVPYVGRARVPLLFQFGRRDSMPRAWLAGHASAAPAPKTVRWYEAPHELCDCATRDRKAWLLARLNAR